jgi:hypothetical protein
MVHDDGDEVGHAERVTLHQGFMAELGRATWAPSRAVVLHNRRLAFHFVSSSTPRRIPSRWGIRGASKRPAPPPLPHVKPRAEASIERRCPVEVRCALAQPCQVRCSWDPSTPHDLDSAGS